MGGRKQSHSKEAKKPCPGKVDLSQEQEEHSPSKVESQETDHPVSPIAELNETLNITRAFSTIRREASKSGHDIQENLARPKNSLLFPDLHFQIRFSFFVNTQHS